MNTAITIIAISPFEKRFIMKKFEKI